MKIAWIGESSEFKRFIKTDIHSSDIDFILVDSFDRAQGVYFDGYIIHWSYTKILIAQRRDVISAVKSRVVKNDWISILAPGSLPSGQYENIQVMFEDGSAGMWNDKWPRLTVTHWRFLK